jgi:hypothetical protein
MLVSLDEPQTEREAQQRDISESITLEVTAPKPVQYVWLRLSGWRPPICLLLCLNQCCLAFSFSQLLDLDRRCTCHNSNMAHHHARA